MKGHLARWSSWPFVYVHVSYQIPASYSFVPKIFLWPVWKQITAHDALKGKVVNDSYASIITTWWDRGASVWTSRQAVTILLHIQHLLQGSLFCSCIATQSVIAWTTWECGVGTYKANCHNDWWVTPETSLCPFWLCISLHLIFLKLMV